MNNVTELKIFLDAVEVYRNTYLNVNWQFPPIPGPHKLDSWFGSHEARKPGCYAFFTEDGSLLYIGKSDSPIEDRVWFWVKKAMKNQPENHWLSKATYVQIINVKECWEAPSLESYLIDKLKPIGNTNGIKNI